MLLDRALTFLNERGDTTISWTEDRDAEMEEIIRKKMAEGVTFFVVEPRRGKRPNATRGDKLADAAEARKQRALVVPDEDLARFVGSGSGEAVSTPQESVKNEKISRDPKEVAKSHSVAVKPRRGG